MASSAWRRSPTVDCRPRSSGLARPSPGYTPAMTSPRIRDTWLVRKHEAMQLGIIYVVFTAVWFSIGYLLTHTLKNSWIVHNDQSISEWFVKQRTPGLNSLSFVGSMLSDTVVKIVVTAVVALVMLIVWKRW